jgi:hypothetical protein
MNARWKRLTAADYEAFLEGHCGMPSGPERDKRARRLTRRLVTMSLEYGVTPPPGLSEFAQRIGVSADEELT